MARKIALECIQSGRKDANIEGLRTLGRIPRSQKSAENDIEILEKACSDNDTFVSAAAIGALYNSCGSIAPQICDLPAYLNSGSTAERKYAALIISEMGWCENPEFLPGLFADTEPQVQAAAAAAVASLDDEQRIAILCLPMLQKIRVRILRACRHRPSTTFCAYLFDELNDNASAEKEILRILISANWRVPDQYQSSFEQLVNNEIQHIYLACNWSERFGTKMRLESTSPSQLHRALMVEAMDAGQLLLNLLSLKYDVDLIQRVSYVLQGRIEGDVAVALESLDLVLAANHRTVIVQALRLAFQQHPQLTRATTAERSRKNVIVDLLGLAQDARWARYPDWMQASALALLKDLGTGPDRLARITPLGPISAELCSGKIAQVDLMTGPNVGQLVYPDKL